MQNLDIIRIGTRGSELALAQANMVANKLKQSHTGITTQIVTIKTTGDKILDKNLNEIGGKGLFIKEIEESLLDGSIDIAVHSMKDMPAHLHDAFEIPCILEREDPRDALISPITKDINGLPQGAVVGTSSPRRASQLLFSRPDVKIVPFRGNIQTRLKKLKKNEADATFLAIAGINRCNIKDDLISVIDDNIMLPAVAQGAVGVEICKNRDDLREILAPLHHVETDQCVQAERAFLAKFEGSCKTPIAALAKIDNNKMFVRFLIANIEGTIIHKTERSGSILDAESMGKDAACELLSKVGENFFK